mgnify:FL=1
MPQISFRLIVCLAAMAAFTTAARPPNVVLIMADDMGYECLGANGGLSYETPRLDALAAGGMRFTRAYSTPLCTPSRVQIMTGRYNVFNYEEFGYLNPELPTFGHMMQDAGYATMIAGKWQLNGISHGPDKFEGWDDPMRPGAAGFDEWSLWQVTQPKKVAERFWDPLIEQNGEVLHAELAGTYGPDHFTDYICDFIERKQYEPFFVYYPMVLVHDPFISTPDSADSEVSGQKAFADMMRYADKLVGRIVDKLATEGLLENTLILFTGDNGTDRRIVSQIAEREVAGAKGMTIDDGIHVPLIAHWPGTTPAGRVTDQLVDFTDFKATLAALTQREGTTVSDGISFLPALRGEAGPVREWVFCHYDPRWGRIRENRAAFVTDGAFKIYHGGRVFAVTEDVLEKQPLDHTSVPPEVLAQLQNALEKFPKFPVVETPFGAPLLP